ncbi:MAG: DUF4038 domain-containing protein [Spirochaetaceae bacterium]|nr:MAG: DUF4038 domain-containing protein [Spirochaetaceae bacterium]
MIRPITVSPTRDRFQVDGAPHFVCADTAWNAFTSATEEEWERYTSYRAEQGFNTIQVSVLPVLHDASLTYTAPTPFASTGGYDNGPWDFSRPSSEYFDRAERMTALAAARGLRICLVLLWNNYVPGTWAHRARPDVELPRELVDPVTTLVAERFRAYHPIYFIAGDTRFETEAITDYFVAAMDAVKRVDPGALAAMHITGNNSSLPPRIVDSPNLDFYTYQSGHRVEHVHGGWQLAEAFLEKYPTRPLMNAEPCYEGHGHAGGVYGRFTPFDVRRALWTSVLAGAKAGFTYGAHGVWGWHRRGAHFTSVANSREPFDWSVALEFGGGWDTAFAARVVERLGLTDLTPDQSVVPDAPEGVRAARVATTGSLVAYLPYADPVRVVAPDAADLRFTIIDLGRRIDLTAEIVRGNGEVVVKMPEVNGDYLIVASP